MSKFFEVVVELEAGIQKNGKTKKVKEAYLVDSQSPTEAEARLVKSFETAGTMLDYRVVSAKESRIINVI
jgi:hypothetical protein